jgi:ATP-binding cassette subfamily B protein
MSLTAAQPSASNMLPHHTALRSLFVLGMHHGYRLKPEQLASADMNDTQGSALRMMRRAGFACRVLTKRKPRYLADLGAAYPVIALRRTGHWVVLVGLMDGEGGKMAAVLDPAGESSGIALEPLAEFAASWNGTLILCKRRPRLLDENQPFSLRWFLPEIARHHRAFRDVAIAATASNLIALATPLLYHVIIDKVVPHRSYQTLTAVAVAFLIAISFDGMFSYIRQQMMQFATNKIDAKLAARIFRHLLSLPLPFFERTTAGVLSRNIQQTEKLRQFLTGRVFQVAVDASAMPVLLVMLLLYSVRLTGVVLAFAGMIAGIIAILVPIYRRRLSALYAVEGARQTHLIESIHGIRTIKSLALEPLRQVEWDRTTVSAVRSHASVGRLAAMANALTSSIDKLMQVSIMGLGAIQVFDGSLGIGALVAFTMLAGRVSGPLVQMIGLINEYQEISLSVKMLATVLDHPPERPPEQRGLMPAINGAVEFDNVTFRYHGSSTPALDRLTFRIEEGQMIGLVGRSGSGKTTVTRLLQGLQAANEGAIRLSGIDIRHIDLVHMRQGVGVVLQDSFLFRGTIGENIAAARPDADMAEIIHCARQAGAEEFIERLPLAYDTFIEEGATNLSGGQRQRIAIARALLRQPRLLIFDEATSALDPESEAVVQNSMTDLRQGRTMLVVSHRLSSLVAADAILVLDQGRAVDFAPHAVLHDRCTIYRHLWDQQTQHMRAA